MVHTVSWYSTTPIRVQVTWFLYQGTLYPWSRYTGYLVLYNPHPFDFPPLSSVMSAFVQTLPVPGVPGDLRPDTTCSNGKINGFSLTSAQFGKIFSLSMEYFPWFPGGNVFLQLFCDWSRLFSTCIDDHRKQRIYKRREDWLRNRFETKPLCSHASAAAAECF